MNGLHSSFSFVLCRLTPCVRHFVGQTRLFSCTRLTRRGSVRSMGFKERKFMGVNKTREILEAFSKMES